MALDVIIGPKALAWIDELRPRPAGYKDQLAVLENVSGCSAADCRHCFSYYNYCFRGALDDLMQHL
jgi:hypothetical protein